MNVTTVALQDGALPVTPPDVATLHAQHGDFVWASLQRLGAREPDLEDLFQEVFLRVHQRRESFEGRSLLTTWLFGICIRVVAAHRRRAWVRRERPSIALSPPGSVHAPALDPVDPGDPETAAQTRHAQERLQAILDGMPLTHRAVFTMAMIEEMSAEAIATQLGVPIGTVWSRLHAARKQFEAGAARWRARDAYGGRR